MIFKTEEERLAHPQAGLFPRVVWKDYYMRLFPAFPLMQAEDLDKAVGFFLDLQPEHRHPYGWLALAYAHPSLSVERMQEHLEKFNIQDEDSRLFVISAYGDVRLIEACYGEIKPNKTFEKIFSRVTRYGHLDTVKYFFQQLDTTDSRDQKWLKKWCHHGLDLAAIQGHLKIVQYFYEQLQDLEPSACASMAELPFSVAVCHASTFGHLDLVKYLIQIQQGLDVSQVPEMMKYGGFEAFKVAVSRQDLDFARELIRYPAVFKAVEKEIGAYGVTFVQPFMAEQLQALRAEKVAFDDEHPEGEFNLRDDNRIKLCYYMIRHLIRRNTPDVLDDIRFLMAIPAVQTTLPIGVTKPKESNELLSLAMDCDNQAAKNLLLDVPAVRELAFDCAVKEGDVEVVKSLLPTQARCLKVSQVLDMLTLFKEAFSSGDIDFAKELLTYPDIFSKVETDIEMNGNVLVQPFIADQLQILRDEERAFEAENPSGVFDVEDESRIRLCFYMIRHLIRQNTADALEAIEFLMNIPAVQQRLHTEVTPDESNELFSLAKRLDNKPAKGLLLQAPGVRAEVESELRMRCMVAKVAVEVFMGNNGLLFQAPDESKREEESSTSDNASGSNGVAYYEKHLVYNTGEGAGDEAALNARASSK